MKYEYDALIANGTWTLVDLPPGRTAIGCKWVFRVKQNWMALLTSTKRLVAKGFHQQFGKITLRLSLQLSNLSLRIILTLAPSLMVGIFSNST